MELFINCLTEIIISVHGDFITKVKVITSSIFHYHIKPWVSGLHHTVWSVTSYSTTDDAMWQNSLPPKRWTLTGIHFSTHTHRHKDVSHNRTQKKTSTQVYCSSSAIFKSLLDAVRLSPVEGSQSTRRADFSCQVVGLRACRRGHGLKWHARFNHLRFPTHSCWERDPSSVLCRVSWSVLGPCSLWGTAWTSCPRNYVL